MLLYSENSHERTGRNGCTDYTCHVRSHCVHQQEVGRISLRTYLLRYTGCHRNSGYTGRTDQRIDLASGKLAHKLYLSSTPPAVPKANATRPRTTILMVLHVQESLCAGGCAYGSTQQDNYDVHQRVGGSLCQLLYNAALTEQVTEHQHTYQRSCGGKQQTNNNGNDDREQDLLQLGNRTKLLHLDLSLFLQ